MEIQSLDSFSSTPEQPSKHGFKRKSDNKGTSVKQLPIGVNFIDLSQIVLSTIFSTFKPEDHIDMDLVRHCILNVIKSHVQNTKTMYPMTILCVDNSKTGYWRKKVAWYYKFKRKEKRDDSKWDYEFIFHAMHTVIDELKENMPYVVLDIEGVEADDHIGVMTKYFTDRGVRVLITSSDGDFTQLQKYPNVKQYSPIQKKPVVPKHGSPELDLKFKCIKGDKKDGIASFKAPSDHYTKEGVRAPSISAKLLAELMSKQYEEMEDIVGSDGFCRIMENKALLDLDMIPDEIKSKIEQQYTDYVIPPRFKIMQYFAQHDMKKLYDAIDQF